MSNIKLYLIIFMIITTVIGQDDREINSKDSPSEPQLPTGGLQYPGEASSEPQLPTGELQYPGEASSEPQLPTGGLQYPGEASSEPQLPTGGLQYPGEISSEPQLPTGGLQYPGEISSEKNILPATVGEPKVTYYTPVGYAPATSGPLTIKKVAHPVETGKGHGNRIRVDVEITSAKKNNVHDKINNIDIYELVDDSLNIVPPADSIIHVAKRTDSPEEFQRSTRKLTFERFSDIPLINFKKLSSVDSIGLLRLNLMRDEPLSSSNLGVYKKINNNTKYKEIIKNIEPHIINYPIFYFNKYKKIDINDSKWINNISKLSDYLEDNFAVYWLEPLNVDVSYPELDDDRKKAIRISKKMENNETDEWIQIQIDDADRDCGLAILETSKGIEYYLRFNTSKTNKDLWEISDWNGVMQFHIRSLNSKDRLFYWYYVRPKKSGDFNTESIIRINDREYSGWPDIIYPLNIEVGSPDFRFDVNPILADTKVYANSDLWKWVPNSSKRLSLKYLITYSGDSSRTYLGKINLTLEQPDKCQIYLDLKEGNPLDDNDLTFYEKNFSKSNTVILKRYISYNKTDTYRIPELWIEGTPHIFKETVIVDDPIKRWYEIFNSYYTILTALLLLLVNKQLREILVDLRGIIHRLIQKIIPRIKNTFKIIASSLGLKKK